MAERFEAYKRVVVAPFFRDHFARVDRQIDSIRRLSPGSGHIHFSMAALAQNRRGVADALRAGPYAAG